MKPRYFSLLLCFLMLAAATGCSSDDPAAAYSEPGFEISARVQQDELPNELIQSWWVLFATPGGEICAIKERTADGTSFVSEHFTLELKRGTYNVYAFANFDRSRFETLYGYSLKVGDYLPAGFDNETYIFAESHYAPESLIPMSGRQLIPMSGRQQVQVTGTAGELIAVEVVRMLGKMEFEFSNQSASDIEVLGVSFGPLYKGPVNLYPLNVPGKPVLLDGSTGETVSYTFATPCALPAATSATDLRHFYVRETNADSHPTGKYHFSLRLRRNGNVEDELYALASDLEYINRNDYIQLPVTIIDWSLELDVQFYPPIGGYPAMLIEERNDEFYIKFGSSGLFSMTPLVRRGSEASYLAPDRLDLTILSVSDPSGILAAAPEIEDGKIIGNLSDAAGASGTAVITVSVDVKENAAAGRAFIRNFYIIR